MPLPPIIPMTPDGQAVLPPPLRREPNHVAKAGTILPDPFSEFMAANRAAGFLGDWNALLSLAGDGR